MGEHVAAQIHDEGMHARLKKNGLDRIGYIAFGLPAHVDRSVGVFEPNAVARLAVAFVFGFVEFDAAPIYMAKRGFQLRFVGDDAAMEIPQAYGGPMVISNTPPLSAQ